MWEKSCGDAARLSAEWLWEMGADLRLTYVSERLRWIIGLDPAYFVGKRRQDYVDVSRGSGVLESHLADLAARRPFRNFIYAVESPDGRRYVRIDGSPLFGEDGEFLGYRGIGAQVTIQVKAQQNASKSFQQLVDAVENLPVGITQYDDQDRLVFWNSAYMKLYPELASLIDYGTRFEQVIRWLGEAGVIPEAVGRIDDWIRETVRLRRAGRAPFEIRLADGRWILISGHRTAAGGIIMVHNDVTAMKERESRLAESARYLKAAARLANLGTWDWDPESNILYNSPETLEICGLGPEKAAVDNEFLMDMIHPDDRAHVRRVMRAAIKAGDPYDQEYRITRTDGSERIFHEHGERTVDVLTGKARVHGTIQDVTDERRRQMDLLESQRLFELAFQQSPGMTAISKIDTGLHVAVNDKWVEIMGWPREEAIGKTALELGVWADLGARAKAMSMLRERGRFKDFEGQYRTRDGEIRDFLISAEKIEFSGTPHMLITGHDITERKRAERELRSSEARLLAILRISPEAVIVTDAEQRITLFNDRAERIFGYSAAEMLGKSIDSLIPPSLRTTHREHVRQFLASGDTSRFMSARQDISALAKGNLVFPAEASISKLEVEGETFFTVLLHDITERKRTEQILMSAKEAAESASRAKSEFLANMSHELRTPLNAILGFSDVIRSEVLGPVGVTKYVEYASDIYRSGTRLLDIISDILDVARIDVGQTKLQERNVTVDELVKPCLDRYGDIAAETRLEIDVAVPPGLPQICCDPHRIEQAIASLLSNAIKFTEPGGQISICATLEGPTGDLLIDVTDNGIGIDPADIELVMEPFAQTENSLTRQRDGVGLGLPIARKLVELHGGSIELKSGPAAGTKARIRLPADRLADDDGQVSLFAGGD